MRSVVERPLLGARRGCSWCKKGLFFNVEGRLLQSCRECTGKERIENSLQEVRAVLYCKAVSMVFCLLFFL